MVMPALSSIPSGKDGVGVLVQCIRERDVSGLQQALEAGADEVLESAGPSGLTPLLYATRVCWPAGVDILLQHGASALSRTPAQDTGLHWASLKGDVQTLHLLISAGGDVNAMGDLGNRPLHLAAAADKLEAIHLLLVSGADLRVANHYGHTPLALSHKSSEARQCLLQMEQGGPEERQRLQQSLALRHQQSMEGREAAQHVGQNDQQQAEERLAAAVKRRQEEDEEEDRLEEEARLATLAAAAAERAEMERRQAEEAAKREAEAAAAKAAALAAKKAKAAKKK